MNVLDDLKQLYAQEALRPLQDGFVCAACEALLVVPSGGLEEPDGETIREPEPHDDGCRYRTLARAIEALELAKYVAEHIYSHDDPLGMQAASDNLRAAFRGEG